MKFKLLLSSLILNWFFSTAQNSLDNLRLVSPSEYSIATGVCRFSDDSKYFVAIHERTPIVYDIMSGKILQILPEYPYDIHGVEFSSNSELLVVATDSIASVYDWKINKKIIDFSYKSAGVENAKFTRDSKNIITSAYHSTTGINFNFYGDNNSDLKNYGDVSLVFSLADKNKISVLRGSFQKDLDNKNIFNSDGKRIIVSDADDGVFRIYEIETGKLIYESKKFNFSKFSNFDTYYSTDGRYILSGYYGEDSLKFLLFSEFEMKIIKEFEFPVRFHFSNNNLIYGFQNDSMSVYNISEDRMESVHIKKTKLGFYQDDSNLTLNEMSFYDSIVFYQNNYVSNDWKFCRVKTKYSYNKGAPPSDLVKQASGVNSIYNLQSGTRQIFMKTPKIIINNISKLNSNSSWIVIPSSYEFRLFNLINPESVSLKTNYERPLKFTSISNDSVYLVSATDEGRESLPLIHNNQTKKSTVLYGNKDEINSIVFSNNNQFLATSSGLEGEYLSEDLHSEDTSLYDFSARIYSNSTGEEIAKFDHKDRVHFASFNKNDQILITACEDGGLRFWEIESKKLIRQLDHSCPLKLIKLSNDGSKIACLSNSDFDGSKIYIYDLKTFSLTNQIILNDQINDIEFSQDDMDLFFTTDYNGIIRWNLLQNKKIADYGQEFTRYYSLLIDNNGIAFSVLNDQSKIIVYHISSKKILFELNCFENNNWFLKLPYSPYYMCSKDASKMLHYVTPNLKVIGFEQLDPVYNRPDIVLDSIGKYFGGADAELVANYREYWEKRIDRLGLDKEKLGKGEIAVPDADIVGADDIVYENKDGKLIIKVKANDPKYTLRRFNVYVNEVPLYGSAGISIAQLKKQQWDTTLSVPLSLGENKIQVSVMNELGLENFKYPTYVNYIPARDKEIVAKTHYIGIGVNAFMQKEHNLTYCVKDVHDLATALSGENTRVKVYTDQKVTRENILALKQYLQDSTTVNDKVIISCSSHGLLDDSLNFYLATHDVDFKNPKARGLKYEELEGLLDGIPARQKLLLLDACNSGENDKTEVLKKELEEKMTRMDSTQVLAARGAIIRLEQENKSNFKKMNELFVNVRNNTGSVIISAAGGQESALEAIEVNGQKIENGAFTYSVLEYLKAHEGKTDALTVNKLKQYVEQRVEEITNGKQKPTSRQETMEVDWRVR